ncbi:MAG: DUF2784 domain-containing protein [Gammaproteobacteria bacterium]|jgi:hypothetical protein
MTPAWAKLAADTIVVLHLSFAVFVMLGAFLLLKWPKWIWVHLPAVCWGILVEFTGWICPLTPLENRLRDQAGLGMYRGDFVMHYLMPVLYPLHLTRTTQVVLGITVVIVNLVIYIHVFRHWRRGPRRDKT